MDFFSEGRRVCRGFFSEGEEEEEEEIEAFWFSFVELEYRLDFNENSPGTRMFKTQVPSEFSLKSSL